MAWVPQEQAGAVASASASSSTTVEAASAFAFDPEPLKERLFDLCDCGDQGCLLAHVSWYCEAQVCHRILLDQAEALVDIEPNLVVTLLRLTLKTNRSLGAVFVTESPDLLRRCYAGTDPLPAELPVPVPPDPVVKQALLDMCPEGEDSAFYANFVDQVCRNFGQATGFNLEELEYIVRAVYPVYRAPVVAGTLATSRTNALQGRVQVALDDIRSRLGHRDASARMAAHIETVFKTATTGAGGRPAFALSSAASGVAGAQAKLPQERRLDLDFPYTIRVLLLAAFCASHNPPDTDARYFRRRKTAHSRAREKTAGAISNAKKAALLNGPRVFTLQRLTEIFTCLYYGNAKGDVDKGRGKEAAPKPGSTGGSGFSTRSIDDAPNSTTVLAGTAMLCDAKLLTRMSPECDLYAIKFQCNMAMEDALQLANAMEVELAKYLWDPAA